MMPANKRRKFLDKFTIPFSLIGLAILLIVLEGFDISPTIPSDVFHGLLATVSILFGFTIVGVFYYHSRVDEYERDYLYAYREITMTVIDERNKIQTRIDLLGKGNPQERKNERIEMEKQVEAINRLRNKLNATRDDLLDTLKAFRIIIRKWARATVAGFGMAIALSVFGLLLPVLRADELALPILIIIAFTTAMSVTDYFDLWNRIQDISDHYSKSLKDIIDAETDFR